MRVHHISNDYSMFTGGAQRVIRWLHRGLQTQGIESHLLGVMAQRDADLEAAQSLGLKSSYRFKAFQGVYRYVVKNVRPGDIVHAHLFPPVFYLSVLKLLGQVRARLIFTEHSTSNRRRGTPLGYLLDVITYAGYDRVVAISEGVEANLLRWKPRLKSKTHVIHNGVRLNFPQPLHHAAKTPLRVVSIGNLRPAKNYDNALKAVALLKDFDFEYCIAGAGGLETNLRMLSQTLGLGSKVKFLGYVKSIVELLASADIFLMPSRWEGFGIAAVEAMNASLPLVTSNVPGLRDVVNCDPPCAELVEPESPEAIAAGLRKLLVSSSVRLEYGQRAFQQAQQFSMDRMVNAYIRVYKDLI